MIGEDAYNIIQTNNVEKVIMLRKFFQSDLKQILEIEKLVHIAPWTEETFKSCFQSGFLGWVIEHEDKIIGFLIMTLNASECHILNIAILSGFQRHGYGEKLLKYAMEHAKKEGAGIVYLEVRRSNSKAISLYRKLNFHLIGERKDYYPIPHGGEDALIFAKSLHQENLLGSVDNWVLK